MAGNDTPFHASSSASAPMSSPDPLLSLLSTPDSDNFTNTTLNDTPEDLFRTPLYALIWISLAFLLVFVVGVLGNLLVIVVVTCVRDMRTPTNVCLMNLSVADLLVLVICQPSALLELYAEERWMLGHFMCKLTVFMENMVCLASILIILSVSFERFYAVCYPLKMYSTESRTKASILMLVMWIVATALSSPFLAITGTQQSLHTLDRVLVTVCLSSTEAEWFQIYIIVRFVVIFVIPLLLLLFVYSRIIYTVAVDTMHSRQMTDKARAQAQRSRQQLVIMLVGVVVLFFVCLLPFHLVAFFTMFRRKSFYSSVEVSFNASYFSRLLIYVNSAGNPIIYSLASTKFRRAFARVLHRLGCRSACLGLAGRPAGRPLHSEENGTLRRATVTHYTSVRQDLSVCERDSGARQSV